MRKVLTQLGIIEVMEHINQQIGVQFLVSQDYIHDQIRELKNQEKAAFLDTLFRQYGGEAFGKMSRI